MKKSNLNDNNDSEACEHVSLPNIHIGQLIHDELKRRKISVTWLAAQIHCDRRNIYDIFTRNSIDTSLLMSISQALNVDFFKIISQSLTSVNDH